MPNLGKIGSHPSWRVIIGVISAGALAAFVIQWLRRPQLKNKKRYRQQQSTDNVDYVTPSEGGSSDSDDEITHQDSVQYTSTHNRTYSPSSSRGSTLRSTRSRRSHRRHQNSITSAATALLQGADETSNTIEDCGRLGVTALNSVIANLEDGLGRFKEFEEKNLLEGGGDVGNNDLMRDLRALLEQAYVIKEKCKQNVIIEAHDYIPSTDASEFGSDESDDDSFVSAAELLDLSDLDQQLANACGQQHLVLYRAALIELEHGTIPVRSVRTQMLGLSSDTDYLAKLHCVRLAYDELLASPSRKEWMITAGREMSCLLLESLGYQTESFELAFQNMLEFIDEGRRETIAQIGEELKPKSVKQVGLFDIVLDYIFLDAFEDLESPPPSLVSVINNRWLSNGFKKTALDSVVWTLILAKKKLLKYPDGFISHYYDICATLSPALAWGFIGPEPETQHMCNLFKDVLLGFVRDTFDNRRVRYTTVEELATDIYSLAQSRSRELHQCLSRKPVNGQM